MSILWLDGEYHDHAEKHIELKCVSAGYDTPTGFAIDFFNTAVPNERGRLCELISKYPTIGCYSSSAEGSVLEALGIDSLSKKWIDVYWMFAMTANGVYNQSITGGNNVLLEDDAVEEEVAAMKHTKSKIPKTLLNACLLFNVPYNHDKEATLRVIIDHETYSNTQWADIRKYCMEDVRVLPILYPRIQQKLIDVYKFTDKELEGYTEYHSIWGARLNRISREGLPLNMGALNRLVSVHGRLVEHMQHEINATVFPVYVGGTQKYERMAQFIDYLGLSDSWPRTQKSGQYCFNRNIVKLSQTPEIQKWYKLKQEIDTLHWFRPDGDVFEKIGSDGVSRPNLIPYGTISSRNSFRARHYLLAMSSWLRTLIQPPPGYTIVAGDYSAQEFAIAAALPGDENMMQCYASGDPYLHFGKLANAIPAEGTKETHGDLRDMFKSTCLGLQFSMGVDKLQHKLHLDTGKAVSYDDAVRLRNTHKQVFSDYWSWIRTVGDMVANSEPLTLQDGWSIRTCAEFKTSYLNFPVQGTGAVVLRNATSRLQQKGLRICSTLHDAIYVICKDGDVADTERLMHEEMTAASREVLHDRLTVRVDFNRHGHNDIWIEKKGKANYERFKHILYPRR
jgi:hypothetical protein